MGEFTAADAKGLTELKVDVAHLANITSYLNALSAAITDDLRPGVYDANRLASTGGDESRSALGDQIPVADELKTRIAATFQAVDSSLKSLATQLEVDGAAITTLAEKYKTAEERNALTASEFMSAVNASRNKV
ncbi:hypothetical protein Aph02nite_40830 [Actinoplanes philippinensis]|uniref:Uncharacterized protein n=1 Tax=Actinoplanes philippinensis TaxID=35752 RepID=A0A1I2GXQ5_9ACTN|nr:hypothetical protein [Actinoplanes philippinensis]GIE78133.1 hypothetical protein Aph02nite_40830 [Actinoplanes philippinensis]SFF21376.1 hypothetical protein SAMN05421541_107213 [Actinoplanes philippinensis]